MQRRLDKLSGSLEALAGLEPMAMPGFIRTGKQNQAKKQTVYEFTE